MGAAILQHCTATWYNTALVNRHFVSIEELEDAQAARCVALQQQPNLIRAVQFTTVFHWWPKRIRTLCRYNSTG
jgi:hypothetical protein